MPRNRIQELLAELRSELQEAKGLGADARAHLAEVLDEVGASVEQTAGAAAAGAESGAERLRERVEETAARFDEEHPRVASTLRAVLEGLNSLGI
ncbi:MAG TPA: DUF4404 family protein [Planctomycetota bacterium]